MQYYISLSHWGLFPISTYYARNLVTHSKAVLIDDYIIKLFPKD